MTRFNNGDVYTGEFVAGSFSRGEFFCALSGDTHHGEWINGLKHGQGHTVYGSKDEYEGWYLIPKFSPEIIYHYNIGGD